MKKLLVPVLLAMSLGAFAQNEKGNGGDVIQCPSYTKLLDVYEAGEKKMVLSTDGESIKDKVLSIISRFKKFDPYRGKFAEEYALEFMSDILKYEAGEKDQLKRLTMVSKKLPDIDDSYDLSVPYECTKHQLVIRRDEKAIGPFDIYKTEYLMNEGLWNELDDENKALTITHEAFYKVATIHDKAQDSRFARHLNGLMSKVERISFIQYMQTLTEAKMYYTFSLPGFHSMLRVTYAIVKDSQGLYKSIPGIYWQVFPFGLYGSRLGYRIENDRVVFTDSLEGHFVGTTVVKNANGELLSWRWNVFGTTKARYENGEIKISGQASEFHDESGNAIRIESEDITFIKLKDVKTRTKGRKVRVHLKNNEILGFEYL